MNRMLACGVALIVLACLISAGHCGGVCSSEGATKTEGNRLCECGYSYIMGQRSNQLQWICRLNGCEDWSEEQGRMVFYEPGQVMQLQGTRCQCVEGSDPYLQDASTLYHIRCSSRK
ncbi:hypothetical protein BOX15_Mlig010735g1 [Macrostomum lignano]|nr:hypothetical protein BOX15_Mlig010735g1 [Macrostomum lignano]